MPDGNLIRFGFKDPSVTTVEQLGGKAVIYLNVKAQIERAKLQRPPKVLVIESQHIERSYHNKAYGNMWREAFRKNGLHEVWDIFPPSFFAGSLDLPGIVGLESNLSFLSADDTVLLFVRGDDIAMESPKSWNLLLTPDERLSAQNLSDNVLRKLRAVKRVLILVVSAYADSAFADLQSIIDENDYTNMALVAFSSQDRKMNSNFIMGWRMSFMAPLFPQFLCYPGMKSVYFEQARERALGGLDLFGKMDTFEAYLDFFKIAQKVTDAERVDVNTYNCNREDLMAFGFIPKEVPPSWFEW